MSCIHQSEELKTKLAVELNDTIDRVLTVPEFLVSGTNLESESFMFAGLDTLMYQTAFTEGNVDKKLNLGVNEPYGICSMFIFGGFYPQLQYQERSVLYLH